MRQLEAYSGSLGLDLAVLLSIFSMCALQARMISTGVIASDHLCDSHES